jgi:hypothetical protein
MNASDFIFLLLHILNFSTLIVLNPPHLPCMPFANCAHLSINYVNSFFDYGNTPIDYTNFSTKCANKSNDCVNTPDDWVNTSSDLIDTIDKYSLDLYIPIPLLLYLWLTNLLVIYNSKINNVLIARSFIRSSSSLFHIYGFYMSQSSSSTSISKSFA